MQLMTARLTLSPMTPADRDFYFALEHDPVVMAFVADNRTDDFIEAQFQSACQPWQKENDTWLSLVVRERESGLAIGVHGLRSTWANRQAELGFLFASAFQGKGYAMEATQAVLDFAKGQGFHKFTAVVTAGNQGSARLLEKCGFEREGVFKEHFLLRGTWHDDWHYGLLARNYNPVS